MMLEALEIAIRTTIIQPGAKKKKKARRVVKRTGVTTDPRLMALGVMLEEVRGGSPSILRTFNHGKGWEARRSGSGYPKWYRDVCKEFGIGRPYFLNAMEKGLSGLRLGKKQAQLYFRMLAFAEEQSRFGETAYWLNMANMAEEAEAQPEPEIIIPF